METNMTKEIKNYEGLYCVYPNGTIYSYTKESSYVSHFGKDLKQFKRMGYLAVNLYKNKKSKTTAVHRIVAQAFIPNPLELKEVNHKDGNKHNNNVENLEWCTRQHNAKHAYNTGLSKISKKSIELSKQRMCKFNQSDVGKKHCSDNGKARRKLSKEQVHDILYQCKVIGKSANSICSHYAVSKPTILKILNGKTYKEFQL